MSTVAPVRCFLVAFHLFWVFKISKKNSSSGLNRETSTTVISDTMEFQSSRGFDLVTVSEGKGFCHMLSDPEFVFFLDIFYLIMLC